MIEQPNEGCPPPLSKCGPNCIEDRVPYVCLHIGAHIFIEAFLRAGVVAGDFECFTYLEIVRQLQPVLAMTFKKETMKESLNK